MNEREMLEMAAKAAGLVNHRYCKIWRCMAEYAPDENKFFGKSWNPRVDDGDALRLAVKLNLLNLLMQLTMHGDAKLYNDDPCAAVRLAITRAAAQIGKSMP